MNITPLEIRQKEFEKAFRGYDKDEVSAFLSSMSQEWERVMDMQKELKIKLESAEKEVDKLRQVENSLYKTLKTAEDTGANVISQANKSAELHLKESQIKADTLIQDANHKAATIVESASQKAQAIMSDMEEELKELAEGLKALETHKENIAEELRNLSAGLNERVKRIEDKVKHVDVETHLKRARNAVKKMKNIDFELPEELDSPKIDFIAENAGETKTEAKREKTTDELPATKTVGEDTSFFDEI